MNSTKIINSAFWKITERVGYQLINFFITIVLARFLGANEYGIVAVMSIFVSFATVIVQEGFSVALIKEKEVDEDLYKSSFIFSIFLALILYIIIFIFSPQIAKFFKMPDIKNMLRVLSFVLFPAAYNSIQVAYYTKKYKFKMMSFSNIFAACISGTVSIIIACKNPTAWCIVINQTLFQILTCLFMAYVGKWKCKGKFSYIKLKSILGFGTKMLTTSLMVNIFLNIRSILIGKFYSAEQLGFFNRGKSFPSTLMDGINSAIQSVLLPVYSEVQDNVNSIKKIMRKTISLSTYIIFPILMGLVCVARPFILLILGPQWENAIIFVQIFAVSYMFQPTVLAITQAFKIQGNGNLVLRCEMYKKVTELILVFSAVLINPIMIALTSVIAGVISIVIIAIPAKKYLKYEYKEILIDFINPLILVGIMGITIFSLNNILKLNNFFVLIIDILMGVVVYIAISIITKNKSFQYIYEKLEERVNWLKKNKFF